MNKAEHINLDNFWCAHMVTDEAYYDSHTHEEYYEILYLLEGEMLRYIYGREFLLSPHSLMLIPVNTLHSWKIYPKHICSRLSIHFSPGFLNTDEQELISLVFNPNQACYVTDIVNMEGWGNIGIIANSILDCKNLDEKIKHIAIRSRLVSLLAEIYRRNQIISPQIMSNKWIDDIIGYISVNLRNDISLDSLARRFSVNKNHLNFLFRKETGTTVYHFIREKRLYLARQEMEMGMNVEQAALSAGFNEYVSFYKAYKEHFGVSPTKDTKKIG